MKPFSYLFLFFILLFSCKNTIENKNNKTPKSNTNEQKEINNEDFSQVNSSSISVGNVTRYDSLPKLSFEKITETTYLHYKNQQKTQLVVPKLPESDSFFYVITKFKKWAFKKATLHAGDIDGENWEAFIGYYPALKMYAITHNSVSEHLGFGNLSLIDSLTSVEYSLISIGDGAVVAPIPSPNNQFLVYYDNAIYDDNNSFICVLKINSGQNTPDFLKEYMSYHSKDWAIEDVVWMNDRSFVLKVYEERYENNVNVKHFSYYQSLLFK
jgi:hypothetical protein